MNIYTTPIAFNLLLLTGTLYSQQLEGYVRDVTGTGIPFASVAIIDCSGYIHTFAYTGDHGFYRLTIKTACDTVKITVRALMYQPLELALPVHNLPVSQNIALQSTGVLQEVVIREKPPPVVVRRDTVEYDAAAFSDSTEFSVEDLVKKMPGVRVNEAGIITYNGKIVERVMLEGDDLFGDNYGMVTQNVRANMISKVQMIDRYQENPILKGIRESDRLIMNLKIKEDKKRPLSGSADAGLGYGGEWKYDLHTNLLSFGHKDRTFLVGNLNNTAESVRSTIDQASGINPFERNRGGLKSNPLRSSPLLPVPSPESNGLPNAYTQANRSGLLFLGQTLTLSQNFKLKISGWLTKERIGQLVVNDSRILIDTGFIRLNERQMTGWRFSPRHIEAEGTYFSSRQHHAFRTFLSIGNRFGRRDLSLVRMQSVNTPFNIVQNMEDHTANMFASIEYSFKKSEHLVFQVTGKNSWGRTNNKLGSEYAWYASFFGLDSTFNRLTQQINQREGMLFLSVQLIGVRSLWQWQIETGMTQQYHQAQSDIQIQNDDGAAWYPEPEQYRNDFCFYLPGYFTNLSTKRLFGELSVRTSLNIRYQPFKLTSPTDDRQARQPLAAEPLLTVGYKFGQYSNLNGQYGYTLEAPAIREVVPAYLFTDYQSLGRGFPASVSFLTGHRGSLRYAFNNPVKMTSFHVHTGVNMRPNGFGARFNITPFLFVSDRFRPVYSNIYSMGGGGEHFFKSMDVNLEAGLNISDIRQQVSVNGDALRDVRNRLYSFNFGGGTAFDTWVNGMFQTTCNYSVTHNHAEGSGGFQGVQWNTTAQITIKPPGRFRLKFFVYQAANRTAPNAYRVFFTADCNAYLLLPKWHSSVEMQAFNLSGNTFFEQSFAEVLTQRTTRIAAVSPFFVLKWSQNF